MKVLGIETSCDESAAAVVEDGRGILSNVISSQAGLHARFGGVVPEIAFRAHAEALPAVIERALAEAKTSSEEIDGVAVTNRPGLLGCLLIGLTAAKTIAAVKRKPLIAVDHIHGHIYAAGMAFPELQYPFVSLIVSGGHTSLFHSRSPLEHQCIGKTLDDAAGETYDKVANIFGLGYPGGPIVDKLAQAGDPARYSFPRSFTGDERIAFSFSGVKTAVLYRAKGQGTRMNPGEPVRMEETELKNLLAGFQEAVTDILVEKTLQAVRGAGARAVAVGGGVAANSRLRAKMKDACQNRELGCFIAPPSLCTDNAAMIAGLGYHFFRAGKSDALASLDAYPTPLERPS